MLQGHETRHAVGPPPHRVRPAPFAPGSPTRLARRRCDRGAAMFCRRNPDAAPCPVAAVPRDRHLPHMSATPDFDVLAASLRACRVCRDAPRHGGPLPHEPKPILQGSATARLYIASQAPGTRAHASGVPFRDPSGVRLRHWLDLDEATFYDPSRVAIVPMGSCFPGQDRKGGDLPPRRECAPEWRGPLFRALPDLELILLIGQYAQAWHLAEG